MYAEVTICAAVDRMRHWNCFGLSVHIVLDLLRTVGQLDMLLLQPYYLSPCCFRLETASGIVYACIFSAHIFNFTP